MTAHNLTQKLIGEDLVAESFYGQGSSREHAALAPCSLGLRFVVARSFARIHAQNLVNFGVLPLRLAESGPDSEHHFEALSLADLHQALGSGRRIRGELEGPSDSVEIAFEHDLSERT